MSVQLAGPVVITAAPGTVGDVPAEIADGSISPAKLRGHKGSGRATMVASAVIVNPGPVVVADDFVGLYDSTPGGTAGPVHTHAITAGGAGVGTFELRTLAAANTQQLGWILLDNTWIT